MSTALLDYTSLQYIQDMDSIRRTKSNRQFLKATGIILMKLCYRASKVYKFVYFFWNAFKLFDDNYIQVGYCVAAILSRNLVHYQVPHV